MNLMWTDLAKLQNAVVFLSLLYTVWAVNQALSHN